MGGTSQLADELLAHQGLRSMDLFTSLCVRDTTAAVKTKSCEMWWLYGCYR